MPNIDTQTLQLAIVAIVALALLIQTIVLLAILSVARKSARSLREDLDDLRSSVMPVIDNTRDLAQNARNVFQRIAPRIEAAAGDLAELAHGLRVQASDVQASATEIVERLRRQSSRIEAMATTILDAIERIGAFMADSVARPMRQVSGLLASARAVVDSLRASAQEHQQPPPPPADKDMFV